MPGSVPAASVSDVWPTGLQYRSFSESRAWPVDINVYADGEAQARARATTSRKGPWQVSVVATASAIATLKTFYDTHGRTAPFYFTPIGETQRAVRFNSGWTQSCTAGYVEVSLELIEIS
jgi:phage-related protein